MGFLRQEWGMVSGCRTHLSFKQKFIKIQGAVAVAVAETLDVLCPSWKKYKILQNSSSGSNIRVCMFQHACAG